jgi:hypothetical protein
MKKNKYFAATIIIALAIAGCKKTGSDTGITVNSTKPTVTTNDVTKIVGTTATLGGNLVTDGGSIITETGICYGTAPGVDTSKNRTPKYAVSGNYTVDVSGLSLLSTYYYKAYAINEKGIVYGTEKSFLVPVNGYSTAAEVAAANLKAYWSFNNNYTETVTNTAGAAVNPADVSFVTGKKGQAVQVKGVGYVNTNMQALVSGLSNFTISTWIQQPASLSGGPTTYMPFSLNQPGYSWTNTKFFMLFESDNASNSYGKVGFMDQWYDKGRVWPKMLDGNWQQMVISYDAASGALRIYVNGALLSESSTSSFLPQTNFGIATSFTLGGPDANTHAGNGWMNALSGNLDEVKIFNKVLSADEVMALYALENKGF